MRQPFRRGARIRFITRALGSEIMESERLRDDVLGQRLLQGGGVIEVAAPDFQAAGPPPRVLGGATGSARSSGWSGVADLFTLRPPFGRLLYESLDQPKTGNGCERPVVCVRGNHDDDHCAHHDADGDRSARSGERLRS